MMGFSLKAAGLMMPLSSNPDLARKVGDLMDQMPEAQ
jgi:hypothetical protein